MMKTIKTLFCFENCRGGIERQTLKNRNIQFFLFVWNLGILFSNVRIRTYCSWCHLTYVYCLSTSLYWCGLVLSFQTTTKVWNFFFIFISADREVWQETAVEPAVAVVNSADESLAPSSTEWCHACLRRFIMSSSKACQACRWKTGMWLVCPAGLW